MTEEIAVKNGRISNCQELVTPTLTLDRVILHTIVHHSSTSTYVPNFIAIEGTFCGRTYVRKYGWTFETHFIRSTQKSRPKNISRNDCVLVNRLQIGSSCPTHSYMLLCISPLTVKHILAERTNLHDLREKYLTVHRALDLRSTGRGFKSYSGQSCVTTLDKLFTPMCLCHQAV